MGHGGASTSNNGSWQSPGDGGQSTCFIVSAFYGENSGVPDSLRRWRDGLFERKDSAGIIFVSMYYALFARPGGWLLHNFPILKPLARKGIIVFVRKYHIGTTKNQ
jgi:hypothetical protein